MIVDWETLSCLLWKGEGTHTCVFVALFLFRMCIFNCEKLVTYVI